MKRLKHHTLTGPNGEKVKLNWMPDGRLRLDFENVDEPVVVTKIFPSLKMTRIELRYKFQKN